MHKFLARTTTSIYIHSIHYPEGRRKVKRYTYIEQVNTMSHYREYVHKLFAQQKWSVVNVVWKVDALILFLILELKNKGY